MKRVNIGKINTLLKRSLRMKSSFRPLTELAGNKENLNALLFLTLGSKYLNLVHNVLEETIKSNNAHIVVSDGNFSWEDYYQKTKWSDFFIIEPVLFCLYHGFELTIKGLILLVDERKAESVHSISILYKKLLTLEKVPKDIKDIVGKYVAPSDNNLISGFLAENSRDIDGLYESLRYPADKDFQSLNSYFRLHYKEAEALEEYKTILQDIRSLQASGTKFYKAYTQE